MAADGVQLLLQPLLHDLGQGIAVITLGVFPRSIAQLLLCALDTGRVGAARDGTNIVVDHRRDLAGVLHHHLVGFFLGQIVELCQHILRGAEEQGRLVVRILEAVARLQHGAVRRILRLSKVHVASGNDRLVQIFAQLDDRAVEVFDVLFAVHLAVPHHVGVVAQRLDLKDVVVGGDLFQFLVAGAIHDGPVQLAGFAGGSEQQAVPVFVQKAPGHPGLFEKVVHMGFADDLVQIFQAHLVLDQNDEVVILLFQHLAVAAKAGVDLTDLCYLLFFQILQHDTKDTAQRGRVLTGAVGLVGRQLQMLVDGALLVIVQAGVHGLRHGQGVDIGRLQPDAAALGGGAQKTHIKGVDVVAHKDAVSRKFEEGFQRFLFAGSIRHHFVGDAGQLGDLGGDGFAGLDKGVKFLHHLAVFHDDGTDLGHILHARVKAGGLGIKDAELPVQRLILHTVHAGDHVVHKVGFASIDQLEIRIGFMDIVRCQHGFRIALTHTVVGDGNGRMPHAVGQLDNAAGVAEAVHAGKLGVQMQLHPLDRCGILPLFALHDEHIVGVDNIIVLVLVVGAVAAHDEGGALAKALPLGAILTFLRTDLQVDGTLIVGDGNGVDLAVVAFDLREEHIAPDDALAALTAQILQRGEVLGSEHFAMENGDRLIGQIQTVHLDGRCGVLFLELDHRRRDLALQLFLQLMLLRLTHGALQCYLRRYPGVRRNALGKQLFKVHFLQKFCAMAHADGDFLANDLDGAPVQKAVDGHAVPLHFVHQAAQSGFIQHGIAKQVLDTQLKAFIVRLQGCQQPGTEIFVQRRTAAQGKDDLPLLPQHLRMLHNDLPEAGRKCRVHHELRPQVGYEWCHKWYSFLYSTNCRTRFLQVWQQKCGFISLQVPLF